MPSKLTCLLIPVCLAGCASIDLPDLDMLDRPFRESATDLEDYPDTAEAPRAPEDVRAAGEWDKAARTLISQRDGFAIPEAASGLDDPAVLREIERLKAEARAYTADDPQPGS